MFKRKKLIPKSIFITGASSGLGKALAEEYAARGIQLYLCGRSIERLEQTAAICRKKGACVETFAFDVSEASVCAAAIRNANNICPIDLVIANAGVSSGVLGVPENNIATLNIFQTNIWGVVNTVLPAITCFKEKKAGQIAIISSIAGYRGMASAPAYSSSKACVKAWGEGLRGFLRPHNISVNVVCPGFIETPLTDKNRFRMPFIMKPEKAAKIIRQKLENDPAVTAFPWPMALGAWLLSALPSFIVLPIVGRFPKKEG